MPQLPRAKGRRADRRHFRGERLTIETDQIPRQSRGRRRRCELLCVSHGARQ
jgi:hypothetical protein